MSCSYRLVRTAVIPVVRWWGRLVIEGGSVLSGGGATLLIANHDSAWDPLIVAVAVRTGQVRALVRASLWHPAPLGWLLDRMGQMPIRRGTGDTAALAAAAAALRNGAWVGVFPEGTVSRGRPLPVRSGAGRLLHAVPQTKLVCVAVSGALDIARFPHRPRIRVEFFTPNLSSSADDPIELTRRAMAEIRRRAPYAIPGRGNKAARYRRLAEQYQPARDAHRP